MSKMRVVAGLFLLFLSSNPKLYGQAYRVGVDPRIELFSIVFRLAGNNEYTQGRVPSYLDAIDRYFAPYRDHPAVKLARELAETDGVGFNAPMNLAVRLDAVPSLTERIPLDSAGIGRAGAGRAEPCDLVRISKLISRIAALAMRQPPIVKQAVVTLVRPLPVRGFPE
jgi:hypothetical protein